MKKYEIKVEQDDAGLVSISKINDGFSPFELLGFIDWLKTDLLNQLSGDVTPDKVSRTVKID